MNKLVKTADLYDCQVPYLKDLFDSCEYPWEMLPKIKSHILALIEAGLPEFTELKPGVWVGKDVKIADYVTIEAPAIIGHGTEIRPGAYIRGNVITGENCVLGAGGVAGGTLEPDGLYVGVPAVRKRDIPRE